MKNWKFWYIQMLQIVFLSSVCPYNLRFCIQHPQSGGGVFECLSGAEKLNLSLCTSHAFHFSFDLCKAKEVNTRTPNEHNGDNPSALTKQPPRMQYMRVT